MYPVIRIKHKNSIHALQEDPRQAFKTRGSIQTNHTGELKYFDRVCIPYSNFIARKFAAIFNAGPSFRFIVWIMCSIFNNNKACPSISSSSKTREQDEQPGIELKHTYINTRPSFRVILRKRQSKILNVNYSIMDRLNWLSIFNYRSCWKKQLKIRRLKY